MIAVVNDPGREHRGSSFSNRRQEKCYGWNTDGIATTQCTLSPSDKANQNEGIEVSTIKNTLPQPTPHSMITSNIDDAVRRRVEGCSYGFVFDKVSWQFDDGILTLRGCVPSFYLKQMLQELLRDIYHVKQIRNEVDVVRANGLSSVRPNNPR